MYLVRQAVLLMAITQITVNDWSNYPRVVTQLFCLDPLWVVSKDLDQYKLSY